MSPSFREIRRQPLKQGTWTVRRLRPSWSVLPAFLIIGAQKAGTTSLFRYLARHPQVRRPLKKEPHFFDFHFDRGLAWYRSHFPWHLTRRKRWVSGEASPYYCFHPQAAARARAVVPESRVIFLLRDPIERAFSHYRHNVKSNAENRNFNEAIEDELREDPDRLAERIKGANHDDRRFQKGAYLSRGLYLHQIRSWEAAFGSRLLLLQTEELSESPDSVYNRVLDFLGLEPFIPPEGFPRYKEGVSMELDPETRARLAAFFNKPNEALYQEFGIDFHL